MKKRLAEIRERVDSVKRAMQRYTDANTDADRNDADHDIQDAHKRLEYAGREDIPYLLDLIEPYLQLEEAARKLVASLGAGQEVYIGTRHIKYDAAFKPDHDRVKALRTALSKIPKKEA